MSASSAEYQQRLEQGRCTQCGKPILDGEELCRRHARAKRKRQARWLRAKRAAREAAGLCVWCPESGPPRLADGRNSCLPCRIRRRRIRDSDVGVDNDVDKQARIAAATRKHADGRTRHHGQGKRGNQPHEQLNRQDSGLAAEVFEQWREGVRVLGTDDVRRMPAVQRDAVRSAVCYLADRCAGHMDDVSERLGHFRLRHGKRDGE